MKSRDYWSFAHLEKLTKNQERDIKHLGEFKPAKIKQEYMGPKKTGRINRFNPDCYIKITPEEIDRQAKIALDLTKKQFEWRDNNVQANRRPILE